MSAPEVLARTGAVRFSVARTHTWGRPYGKDGSYHTEITTNILNLMTLAYGVASELGGIFDCPRGFIVNVIINFTLH